MFVGPPPEILEQLGDKIAARGSPRRPGVPVLCGARRAADSPARRRRNSAESAGLSRSSSRRPRGAADAACASSTSRDELATALEQAQRESQAAFGSADVFVEKFIHRPRHIEVQLLGDKHGNLVHLYERDCSVQRRHQKVVEIAPAPESRSRSCATAILRRGARRSATPSNYENAGTVEFLVDADTDKFYFIEVNPRIQVEHTVTEEVTGVDIVKSQILVAEGRTLCPTRKSAWLARSDSHQRLSPCSAA